MEECVLNFCQGRCDKCGNLGVHDLCGGWLLCKICHELLTNHIGSTPDVEEVR